VQIAHETCRANVVNKEIKNSVLIVGLELNIHVTKMYETTNIKKGTSSLVTKFPKHKIQRNRLEIEDYNNISLFS
jgi:hypothetical protein